MRKIIQIAFRPPFTEGYYSCAEPQLYALCDDGMVLEHKDGIGWLVFSYPDDIPDLKSDKVDEDAK